MILDLFVLDAGVARAHQILVRALAKLPDSDPTDALREVAARGVYKELAEMPAGLHRDALMRWVYELLQARVAWPLLVDEAEAIDKVDEAMLRPNAPPIPKTFREALAALVLARNAVEIGTALARLDELAAPVVAVRRELRERRAEAARRLDLPHAWAQADELGALARGVLDATEPLATELRRDLEKRSEARGAALVLDDAFGREAREGWPAHLNGRWLEDVFRAVAPRAPRDVPMPAPIGGASFLRAAHAWGMALRIGSTARSLPFALARDPQPALAHAFGGALALAMADRPFARRALGLPARMADAHARPLGRVLLFALRRAAVDVLLGLDPRDAEELETRLTSGRLGRAFAYGGFAGKTRIDAPARLVGALRGHALATTLRDRFDEDWFANPRAGAYLAQIGAGPMVGDEPWPEAAPAARALEAWLG